MASRYGTAIILAAIVCLSHPSQAADTNGLRISEIKLSNTLTPISLFGDSTLDIVLNVGDSSIGTDDHGHLIFLAKEARADQAVANSSKSTSEWWSQSYIQIDLDKGGPDGTQGFPWSSHVDEFPYEDNKLYKKYENGKFVATYVVHSVVKLGPHASWAEDTTGATEKLYLYKLVSEAGSGTGYPNELYFRLLGVKRLARIAFADDLTAIIQKMISEN